MIIENGGEELEMAEILSRNIIFMPDSSRVIVWCHLGAMTMDKENHMPDAAVCPQGAVRTGP